MDFYLIFFFFFFFFFFSFFFFLIIIYICCDFEYSFCYKLPLLIGSAFFFAFLGTAFRL